MKLRGSKSSRREFFDIKVCGANQSYEVTWEEVGIDSMLPFEEKVRLYDEMIKVDILNMTGTEEKGADKS